jgi:hypothetical protein
MAYILSPNLWLLAKLYSQVGCLKANGYPWHLWAIRIFCSIILYCTIKMCPHYRHLQEHWQPSAITPVSCQKDQDLPLQAQRSLKLARSPSHHEVPFERLLTPNRPSLGNISLNYSAVHKKRGRKVEGKTRRERQWGPVRNGLSLSHLFSGSSLTLPIQSAKMVYYTKKGMCV